MLNNPSNNTARDWPQKKERTMPIIQTILHPTDFSENSHPAFEMACALARDYHAKLFILNVVMPPTAPLVEPFEPADWHLPWPRPSDPQIRVEHRSVEGDAPTEILRLAEEQHCDLIVMGTHGKTGLGRLLTGSVAEEVLRKALCQVLVVKSPLRATSDAEPEATADPGDLIDVRPLGMSLVSAHTRTLLHTTAVEVVRLIVRADQEIEIPRHKTKGEMIVHCLEGRVAFTGMGKTQLLETGKLLDLPADEPHAFKGIEDASILLTIVLPKH